MGMYTGFRGEIRLRIDTPQEVIEILDYMLGRGTQVRAWPHPINNAMAECWRAHWMFNGGSVYLDDDFPPDSSRDGLTLRLSFNIKNYECEIKKFLLWIAPYVLEAEDCAYRYEEAEAETSLIHSAACWYTENSTGYLDLLAP